MGDTQDFLITIATSPCLGQLSTRIFLDACLFSCLTCIQYAPFSSRNEIITSAVVKEAMSAALILAVKNPRGKSYENFIAEVRTKTSESPFCSQHYNHSEGHTMTVSTLI